MQRVTLEVFQLHFRMRPSVCEGGVEEKQIQRKNRNQMYSNMFQFTHGHPDFQFGLSID